MVKMRNGPLELLAELRDRINEWKQTLNDQVSVTFTKKSWKMILGHIEKLEGDAILLRAALDAEVSAPAHRGSSRFMSSADAVATVTLRSKHDTEVVGTPFIFEVTKSRFSQGVSRHSFENLDTMVSFLKGFLTVEKEKQ
jgi:hypothetical protein